MNEVFHLQKSYRNLAIVGLLFFVVMMVVGVYLALSEANILLAVVFGGFWGCWAGLSVWILLAYYRESLCIQDGIVVQKGLFRTKSIHLSELNDVRWRTRGAIILRSRSGRITIYLGNFEPEQIQRLIRLLHLSVPNATQWGWDRFCYAVAMPLLWRLGYNRLQQHVLIRWHIDRIFIPVIPLVAALGLGISWYSHQTVWLIMPIPFLIVWAAVRAGIPAKGITMSNRGRLDRRFLLGLVIWGAVGIAGAILFDSYKHYLLHRSWWGWVGVLVWFAVLSLHGHRAEQRMWHGEQENVELAVQDWERYEAHHIDSPESGIGE